MNRKRTPFHDFWHKKVEGQIRDTITHHPQWFNLPNDNVKNHMINSLAKRIVGEIGVALRVSPLPPGVVEKCAERVKNEDVRIVSHSGGDVGISASPLYEEF